MSSYRRASLDTWSDLSSDTTNGVTEYSYTTYPDWAADAVIQTTTGIELNFERLNNLCMSESLPSRITIDVLPFPASSGSRVPRHELAGDDTIENTHFTPPLVRNVPKLNGSKTVPWTEQSKGQEAKPGHPKFTRKESIVEQEVRLQMEREKELSLERQLITKAKLSTPAEEVQPEINKRLDIDVRPSPSPDSQCSPVENGVSKSATTPKLSSQISKSKQIYQLNSSARSPSVDISDSSTSSPWYTSESPIARDIRTTHEREQALKVTRRQSCNTSLTSPQEKP